jgi:hypothetical protein
MCIQRERKREITVDCQMGNRPDLLATYRVKLLPAAASQFHSVFLWFLLFRRNTVVIKCLNLLYL